MIVIRGTTCLALLVKRMVSSPKELHGQGLHTTPVRAAPAQAANKSAMFVAMRLQGILSFGFWVSSVAEARLLQARGRSVRKRDTVRSQAFASASGPSAAFGASVAVLGRLEGACAQPSDFSVSPPGAPVLHEVSVFFRTEQSAGAGGAVVLDAPALFDFGSACAVRDLEVGYYDRGSGERTWALPGILGCDGDRAWGETAAFNRATVALGGTLHGGRHFGFRIRVANAASYAPSQQSAWRLWTRTSGGITCLTLLV